MRESTSTRPILTAPLMGYGHLRAAFALGEHLGIEVQRSDEPPLAGGHERKIWRRVRDMYESLSRTSQRPVSGLAALHFLDWLTDIPPLDTTRDLTVPTRSAHTLERIVAQGFGRATCQAVRTTGRPLLTTYFSSAIAVDRFRAGRAYCVVTDSDINRVWASMRPERTRIQYFAPTHRVRRRLRAFGVPAANIRVTGFPLPPSLIGDHEAGILKQNLAARLARLDPHATLRKRLDAKGLSYLVPAPRSRIDRPPRLVFAVGGAGAQAAMVSRFLPSVRRHVESERLEVVLVAGVRAKVARRMIQWVKDAGLGAYLGTRVRVLWRPDFGSYYASFNGLLSDADVLWTKPGELVFYAGLGLPLILSPPVGVQEKSNSHWVLSGGAAVVQENPRTTGSWLMEWIEDGVLAGAAWSGYVRLPHDGTRRICQAVADDAAGEESHTA